MIRSAYRVQVNVYAYLKRHKSFSYCVVIINKTSPTVAAYTQPIICPSSAAQVTEECK